MSAPSSEAQAQFPRLSPQVRERLDRVARRVHAFHRFAHHPLCDRYRNELIQLGRNGSHATQVCRGCVSAGLGAVLGLGLGIGLRGSLTTPALFAATSVAVALALTSLRLPKSLKRGLPAALLGVAILGGSWPGALLSGIAAGGAFLLYRRRGPHRRPCATCPERTQPVCSGYARIYRRERAFQRWSARVPTAS